MSLWCFSNSGVLGEPCSKPVKFHVAAAKYLLRYLKGSPDLSIEYPTGNFRLKGYSYASWGATPDNRWPASGYRVFLSGALASSKSTPRKQTTQSTLESELLAMACREKKVLRSIYFVCTMGARIRKRVQ